MAQLTFFQFPYDSDNYGVLIHDAASGATACVDAGNAAATLAALAKQNWTLSHLLITHHHGDHTAGLAEIKASTGCHVIGPKPLSSAIAGIDHAVGDGDNFEFAGNTVKVMHTPGHTTDMMNFYFVDDKAVFTGDTLFSMGCGRLFEGDAAMMWHSLQKFASLPDDTTVYCAHEYTATNARFAASVDPHNTALQARIEEVTALRADNLPTVPSLLSVERATNPFLRTSDAGIRSAIDMLDADEIAVFAELRSRRDKL